VEALFSFPDTSLLSKLLFELGFPFDGELLIKRTIFREGRNKIIINGSMATLHMLTRLGPLLISVSGQHEHQFFLKSDNHLYLLDDFGGLSEDRLKLGEEFSRYQSLDKEIHLLEKEVKETGERQDLACFQVQEIESPGFRAGEDELLSEEKRRLEHAQEILEIVTEGYQTLYERHNSVHSSISRCGKKMENGANMDPRLVSIKDALAEIEVKLEDVSFSLRDFQKTIRVDPHKLEAVAERLELMNRLKRKYGPTLEDVFGFKEKLTSKIYDLDDKKEELDQSRKTRQELKAKVISHATEISKKRKKATRILEKAVEKELKLLHMEETRFQVKLDKEGHDPCEKEEGIIRELRADGFDHVEFMISPNVGEELRPLVKIASG